MSPLKRPSLATLLKTAGTPGPLPAPSSPGTWTLTPYAFHSLVHHLPLPHRNAGILDSSGRYCLEQHPASSGCSITVHLFIKEWTPPDALCLSLRPSPRNLPSHSRPPRVWAGWLSGKTPSAGSETRDWRRRGGGGNHPSRILDSALFLTHWETWLLSLQH